MMFKMRYYCLLLEISTIHDFLSFYIVVSKREEWKVEALLWSAPGDINIATPLQWSMQGDITSLVQSVKKSIALIGLNIFFLCFNSRITRNISKTCFR